MIVERIITIGALGLDVIVGIADAAAAFDIRYGSHAVYGCVALIAMLILLEADRGGVGR